VLGLLELGLRHDVAHGAMLDTRARFAPR
jgi:hypothetical protein